MRGSAAGRLLGLQVWWHGCLYYVLQVKDKRQNAGQQDTETSTDEVQSTRKYKKEKPAGSCMSVFCECCTLHVEASATGRSLVEGSPTECMSLCAI